MQDLRTGALEALREYCGIAASFVDALGVTQLTSTDTRAALLAAMGIEAANEADAHQALNALQAQDSEHSLPPVLVHYQSSGPIEIDVIPRASSQPLNWRLDLESGASMRGLLKQRPATGDRAEASAWRWSLCIEDEIPSGYHRLTLGKGNSTCSLIVTPGRCWLPERIESGENLWGVAAQVYLLGSKSNWGIGDYSDLKQLVQSLAARGADVVGVNPLHAMFLDTPEQASPYSLASRLLLNVLNIDVARVSDNMRCAAASSRLASPAFQQSLSQCRDARSLDYSAVTALKIPMLRDLFECCDRTTPGWQEFISFRTAAGPAFERSCLFLALREEFARDASGAGDWHRWPQDYRSPQSAATLRFAAEHAQAVTFQAWLQFIADSQLRECSEAAAGMAMGLYRDLAVGADSSGAETWANQLAVIDTAQVGAPPDIYNPQGQDWGLPPFNPRALRAEGYRSFIELLRANMRHAGGLRIDHVMALKHLYWVPRGFSPADGAYVRYPLEDLVGILALESQRNRCLIVGEDLGTVPEGFRERMQRANILSYRVLFFEKDADGFIAPEKYPRLALAVAGSHDLPTLRAWWQGADLALKERLGLFPTATHLFEAKAQREAERAALLQLLRQQNLLDSEVVDEERFVEATHAFLASTASALTVLQLDDLAGEVDPVNVPTTSDQYPNWRRRLTLSLEHIADDPRFNVRQRTAMNRPRL